MTPVASSDARLKELARRRGIQLGYTGHDGRRVPASRTTLLGVLSALGHPVADEADVADQLDALSAAEARPGLDVVQVMRADGKVTTPLRIGGSTDLGAARLRAELEDGRVVESSLAELAARPVAVTDGQVEVDLAALAIPPGYHRLELVLPGNRRSTALLLAPPRPRRPPIGGLGVFSPVYALRSEPDWGIGSYRDLATFADWVGASGGDVAGTLPLFASFTRTPMDPSPYLPVSRRFWNDLFIDLPSLPEYAAAPGDVDPAVSGSVIVDYDDVVARKRAALERCAAALLSTPSVRRDEFEAFVKQHPDLVQYAEFRAAEEQHGGPWRDWTAAPGGLPAGRLDDRAVRYHQYAQFVAAEQVADTAGRRAGLYLDLPVGVHPDGYDTWANPDLFAAAGVGAPPDDFFAGGQSWGFPPLHPDRLRAGGYRYLIAAYRHVLTHSKAIRIDHVLGLQRMFWIPSGGTAATGAYVRYPMAELRAVVAIEAARADAVVVGEDLGTVSPAIRHAMDRDRMLHTFVYQFHATADDPLPQPRKQSMVSMGGHDLPRFATYWRGGDIDERVADGTLDGDEASKERRDREALVAAIPTPGHERGSDGAVQAALVSCLQALADGPASYVSIDLADLELETVPDNRPGTGPEAGNWRHRLSRAFDDIAADDTVAAVMADVATRRSTIRGKGVGA